MALLADLDDALLEQAGEWYALFTSEEITGSQLEALEGWIIADPRHGRAFDLIVQLERELRGMNSLRKPTPVRLKTDKGADVIPFDAARDLERAEREVPIENVGSTLGFAAAVSRRNFRRSGVRWGGLTALAASLALMIGVSAIRNTLPGEPATTRIAQTRVLKFRDGSRVTLGPASRISSRIDVTARSVALLAGEAFFEVAHDTTRPFWVEIGDARVQVVGTKFDVNRTSGRVQVSVLNGIVKVHEPTSLFTKSVVQVLRARQTIETTDTSPMIFTASPPTRISADPVPAGDWRKGRRTYVDARLGDVIADLNRYYAPGLKLTDPGLSDVRIAVDLNPADIEAFFEILPMVAHVRVEKSPSGAVAIEPAR